MQDAIRVLAGDCTVTYEDDDARTQRGAAVVLVKPDNTVLVHAAGGYQPAAWLTRADTVRYESDADGFTLAAAKGSERLRVESHEMTGDAHYPATPLGPPVGDCPDCGGAMVRDGGQVVCTDCRATYAIPRDATVVDDTCDACGLPRMRADRGDTFEVCIDRACESLDDAVRERFDGEWACPDCGDPLAVRRNRGLRAVCEDCGVSLPVPTGVVDGACDCGLPRFDAPGGSRCLDPSCASGAS